ncbi:MAG: hypothetical protein ABTQ29_07460 [Siculibacillus sp.]
MSARLSKLARIGAGPALVVLTLALAGCGSMEGIGNKILSGTGSEPEPMDPKIYAATPVCPNAEVRDGTEVMPIWEPTRPGEPQKVRFQAGVQRVARDCEAFGDGLKVRVGVAGRVLSGPGGASGSVTVPIRVAAVVGEKVVYSKVTTATVTVQAPDYSALFSVVDDNVVMSIADSHDATIYVGLDGKGDPVGPKKGKKPVSK